MNSQGALALSTMGVSKCPRNDRQRMALEACVSIVVHHLTEGAVAGLQISPIVMIRYENRTCLDTVCPVVTYNRIHMYKYIKTTLSIAKAGIVKPPPGDIVSS